MPRTFSSMHDAEFAARVDASPRRIGGEVPGSRLAHLAEDCSSTVPDSEGTLYVVIVSASGSAVACSRVAHVTDQSERDRR